MSNSIPIIVIFGITGQQGSAAADALLKYYPGRFKLRGVTRNPGSTAASAWAGKGVEIVQGDLDDIDTVKNAVGGAYGVFVFFFPKDQARVAGQVFKDAKIQHLIYSTTSDTHKPEAQHVDHIHAKALNESMFRHELKLSITIIKPPAFMENFLSSPGWGGRFFSIVDGEVNTFHHGNTKVPWVACSDIGKIVAVSFANPKENIGKDILVVSDYRSGEELAEICTKVYGKPFIYKTSPGLSQFIAQMPDFGKAFQYFIDSVAVTDYTEKVKESDQFLKDVGGVTLFETWLRQHATAILPTDSN